MVLVSMISIFRSNPGASLATEADTATFGLVTISVYPPRVALQGSKARQALVVTAYYSSGLEQDVTGQTQFTADGTAVVEIRPTGIAVPLHEGSGKVIATFDWKTAAIDISVADLTSQRPVSFLRDVAPILTQKGCTGSNCHGSVRGKAGFKLSLFGARPDLDFEAVVKAGDGRRIDREDPGQSLILRKPTFQEPHGGGERFRMDSIEYIVIREWIATGLQYDSPGPTLEDVSVYPGDRILVGVGSKQRLIVTGKLSDGTQVDLSREVRYSSNDEGVAAVDDSGEVSARRPGETAIMIRTLGRAAVAKIVVIEKAAGADYPEVAVNNFIDRAVFAKLKKLNIVPSQMSEDSAFLRRIYLDTLGVLPTVEEAREFMASRDPQKRSQLIDGLLSRREFVDLWSLKLADLFQAGASDVKGGWQLYRWIRQSLIDNKPYDQMVRELLLGAGAFVYDPTVNFYKGLWDGPEGMVPQVSQSLLGIRMDCAKCHDHPFENWTQDDFYGLAAFFTRLEYKAESYGLFERAIAVRPTPKPSYDYVNNNKELVHPKTKAPLTPRFLGGKVVADPPGRDIREKLAEWVTAPDNPWFARAITNRVWKHFLGRGIVEPVDDFRVTNPPSNEPLLDSLAAQLVKERYNLRELVKVILNSRTYQLSSIPNLTNAGDTVNYSRYYLKRQMAEVLFDSMGQAVGVRLKIPGYPPNSKAISVAVGSPNYFLMAFGRVESRDQISERDDQPNVAQAMHLVNGETINNLVTAPANIIDRVLAQSNWTDERRLEEIYLASLSRLPTAEELAELLPRLAADETARRKIYQDLLWAILNSKEFEYIH
jgi:uncharacterized protein DUF1549/uncharacterized protein DUF1553